MTQDPTRTRLPADAGLDSVDEVRREEFELAWLTGERKRIEDCLPDEDDSRFLRTLEELVGIELELTWRAFEKARCSTTLTHVANTRTLRRPDEVEGYFGRFPALRDDAVSGRLIQQEFLVRRRFGDHPDVAEYERRFPKLDVVSLLSPDALQLPAACYEDNVPPASTADPTQQFPKIPGHDIIGHLGTGGMGTVFQARQRAADRVVAVKVLRTDRLNALPPEQRGDIIDRLTVEAQATARLDHPHVVSVYEVNLDDAAMPWFSMQFVEGRSLAEHLAGGPVKPRAAVEFTRQIASAISCAHRHGVLHRDLKPQNVFLRESDGQLLVGDFGLAKIQLDDASRTSEDDILGTPAYMAPEQIRDPSRVDAQADVWSIGATLYHMLTGRPPFQAATSVETLRQVLECDIVSPRRLNPSVNRDLETICLKCLQPQPSARYAGVEALEADLQAFLDGRPITARPVSRVEHAIRWCRRNPVPAAFAGLAIAGVFSALVALLIGYRTAASALERSNTSLTNERTARIDSDRSHTLARQTVNDLFTEVSETVLLNKPGMQPLRRRLLERTLQYYRRFAQSGRHSPAMKSELAVVWYRIGMIEDELGNEAAAETALTTARNAQEQLIKQDPTAEHRADLASTLNALGALHLRQRQWETARSWFDQALAIRESLTEADPTSFEFRREHANTIMNLGAVARNLGDPARARELFLASADLHRATLSHVGIPPRAEQLSRRELAKALYNGVNAALDADDPEQYGDLLSPLQESAGLFADLLKVESDNYTDRRRLVLCYQLQSEIEPDPSAAAGLASHAVEEMQRLVNENRDVPDLVIELAQLELHLGRLQSELGQFRDAEATFLRGDERLQQLSTADHDLTRRDRIVLKAEASLAASLSGTPDVSARLQSSLQEIAAALAEFAEDPELLELQDRLRLELQGTAL